MSHLIKGKWKYIKVVLYNKKQFFLFERDSYNMERGFYNYANLIFTGHFYKKKYENVSSWQKFKYYMN